MKVLGREVTYEKLKDNIGMIILVPTVLGGIWQVRSLLNLGTPYMRFFSVSQLIADGLLILFILSIVFIGCLLELRIVAIIFKNIMKTPADGSEVGEDLSKMEFLLKRNVTRRERITGFLQLALMIAGLWFFYVVTRGQSYPVFDGGRVSVLDIVIVFGVITCALIFIEVLLVGGLNVFGRRFNIQNKRFKEVIKYLLMLLVPVIIIAVIQIPTIFQHSFLLPENLVNQRYIEAQIVPRNPKLKSWDIAYFNDKFVFVAIEDSSNKRMIEVLEFDALFAVPEKK